MTVCLDNQKDSAAKTVSNGKRVDFCNPLLKEKYARKEPNIFRLEKHPLFDPVLSC